MHSFTPKHIGPVLLLLLFSFGCGGDQAATSKPAREHAAETAPKFQAPPSAWFEEVEAGLDFEHRYANERRFWMPETVGAGLAFFDVDSDGRLDLYAVQSGDILQQDGVNALFHNLGDGTFANVTKTRGGGDPGYGMGCAAGDTDGDGDTDFYVTNLGPNTLYRNDDGHLIDASLSSGTAHEGWGTSTVFLDHDNDGDLDLFVTNYLNWNAAREIDCSTIYSALDYCSPKNYNAPAQDVLYRNEGGGRFQDVTQVAGITGFGNGLGVAVGDFDANGHVDIYVANDLMANRLWANQGDGTFVDDALIAGCAVNMNGVAEAGMGVVAHDLQNDGDLDLFMTHLNAQSNTFYLNEGGGFVDETISLGLAAPSLQYTGFGVGFGDFDNDGLDDIFVANGRVAAGRPFFRPMDAYAEPNLLLRGLENGRFQEIPGCGLAAPVYGNTRGAAFGDYDDDGDIDVALLENGSRLKLLRNTLGSNANWIRIRVLEGSGGDAIGARVAIGPKSSRRWRHIQPGYSYCSSNDPRAHFGLGSSSKAIEVHVIWSDGTSHSFGTLSANRSHTLRRP